MRWTSHHMLQYQWQPKDYYGISITESGIAQAVHYPVTSHQPGFPHEACCWTPMKQYYWQNIFSTWNRIFDSTAQYSSNCKKSHAPIEAYYLALMIGHIATYRTLGCSFRLSSLLQSFCCYHFPKNRNDICSTIHKYAEKSWIIYTYNMRINRHLLVPHRYQNWPTRAFMSQAYQT